MRRRCTFGSNGESEPREAAVIASDPSRDLALLRLEVSGLSAATFAAPGDVRLGDEVLAIGYALDLDGDPTVTLGIVSSLDRTLSTEAGPLKGLIQTDAAVSSGNSGGPLINAAGRVVGINTLVLSTDVGSTANGLGFAISVDELLPNLDQLRAQANGRTLVQGYLGVQLERRRDGGSGALVVEVFAGLPAANAGIEVGDIVIAVDGEPISGQAGLGATVRNLVPGDEAIVSMVRDGKPLDVSVVVGQRPRIRSGQIDTSGKRSSSRGCPGTIDSYGGECNHGLVAYRGVAAEVAEADGSSPRSRSAGGTRR